MNLVQKKAYPYMSITTPLQRLLEPRMLEKCHEWKSREAPEGLLTDVFDRKIWKDFLNADNEPFLSAENTFGLMLNIDWFQPYKHTQYSVGVIYLIVMNLPRSERFRRENLIVVGIIPGPNEPSLTVNSFLDQMVVELNELWKGVNIKLSGVDTMIRGALLCTGCDIPAGKKVCGFKGFGTPRGCSRCSKEFSGSGFVRNYGEFNRSEWPCRSNQEHRRQVEELKKARTYKERDDIESKYGIRFSSLLKLPYYDAIRMSSIVDPLHNLYLGTAKHILKDIWIAKEMIRSTEFQCIQDRTDETFCPLDIGRIPSSSFSGFTGQQWENWVELFSLISLQGILTDDLECWRHFVLASRIISKTAIIVNEVALADALLLVLLKKCKTLWY